MLSLAPGEFALQFPHSPLKLGGTADFQQQNTPRRDGEFGDQVTLCDRPERTMELVGDDGHTDCAGWN